MTIVSTSMRTRWVTAFVFLLLAATALFVIGVAVERSNGHTESTPTSTTSVPSDEGDTSEHSDEANTGAQTGEGTRRQVRKSSASTPKARPWSS
jgi:hypothetical protein